MSHAPAATAAPAAPAAPPASRRAARLGTAALVPLAAAAALVCSDAAAGPGTPADVPYEVWLVDQSDAPGKAFGGTLYVFDGAELSGPAAASARPRERVDLSADAAALCLASTGANPVRPHMLAFNREHTHAVLAFVASGHVVVFDAASRRPLACVRTTRSATGQQAHAAFPSPDGSYVLVANQNGKRLERVTADFRANAFTHDAAATLDLATCTTPGGRPCEAAGVRPDNAPICPLISADGRLAFVTLRGGGMLVVDPRPTPMRIVAEYDMAAVKGNGCGGAQVGDHMYVNSGGRPGVLAHLGMFGFDVYRFPLSAFATGGAAPNAPNAPAPAVLLTRPGEHDSHGMAATADDRFVWVMDRHANVAEVISTATGAAVRSVPLAGALTPDPAPDLVDRSPAGDRLFVALRGPTPLSGDPHIATGATPGLGVIELTGGGSGGALTAVLRVTNVDASGVERADAHAVRVRRK
jgi:DNA-binding beta-propeller fold protein YncE